MTDISGECKAGATPHTTWYPTMQDNVKVPNICKKAGFGTDPPTAKAASRALVATTAFFKAVTFGSTGTTSTLCSSFFFNSEAEVTIGGGGHLSSPPSRTIDCLTTSSLMSTWLMLAWVWPSPGLIVPAM